MGRSLESFKRRGARLCKDADRLCLNLAGGGKGGEAYGLFKSGDPIKVSPDKTASLYTFKFCFKDDL